MTVCAYLSDPIIKDYVVADICIGLMVQVIHCPPTVDLLPCYGMLYATTDTKIDDDAGVNVVDVALAVIAGTEGTVDEAKGGLGEDFAFAVVCKKGHANLAMLERAHERVERTGREVIGVMPATL